MMTAYLTSRRALCALAGTLALTVPVSGQQQQSETEFASWRVPGWSVTPGLAIGVTRDTNVALAAPGEFGLPEPDTLFGVEPFGTLEFFAPRTEFSAGYRGYLRRYVEVDQLNGLDQRVQVVLRHQATKRLTVFVRDHYSDVPTTDEVLLNGLPFVRTGARTNNFAGGVEARLTKFTDLKSRYELTWVEFDNKSNDLTGGWLNGVSTEVTHRINRRTAVGGEYSVRFANLNEGTHAVRFHDAGGTLTVEIGPHTTFQAAAGMSYLSDALLNVTRTGPYYRVGVVQRLERANVGATYERTFIPAFGFGGANESQELRGYVHMPIPSNRAYVEGSLAWRHSVPLFRATTLELDSIVGRSTVGYALARWFRVEGVYAFTRQDSKVTGGEINRHRIGVQVVLSQPMRIQ